MAVCYCRRNANQLTNASSKWSVRDDLFFFVGVLFLVNLLLSPSPSKPTHHQHTMGQGSSQNAEKDAEKRDPNNPNKKQNAKAHENPPKHKKSEKKHQSDTTQTTTAHEIGNPSLHPSLSVVRPLHLYELIYIGYNCGCDV